MNHRDMFRNAIEEAKAQQAYGPVYGHQDQPAHSNYSAAVVHQAPQQACACQHHQAGPVQPVYMMAPVPQPHYQRPIGRTLLLGAAGAVGVLAVLGTLTALFLAVALSAVAISVACLVIVFLVRSIRKAQ